ncbi:MAG: hypothetical protein AB8B52_13950 [Winogradskyella sp.]|uniref:hypothetical protein n=1 Tax=Winogradskyella sp. TaxID=1883156 RepID=UPI00385CE940
MKVVKIVLSSSLALFLLLLTCIQCTSMPKLQKESPTDITNSYYQKWNAGIQEGGSGIDLYIETKDTLVVLDSVFFRGYVGKLKRDPSNNKLFIARFKTITKASESDSKWSFQIENTECVVGYLLESKTRYFKISDLKQQRTLNYPIAPSNK